MTSSGDTPDLQFDRADFGDGTRAAAACVMCKQGIQGPYFEANGQVICATCRGLLAQAHGDDPGMRGVLLAIAAGLGVGAVGGLVYYAVFVLTNYEFALISVAIGFAVGKAVRWASNGRGGLKYQIIAVAITYVSIVGTYTPFIVAGMREGRVDAGPVAIALITLASPFLMGLRNVLGWAIIGFALWEAWKITRRLPLTITGPFTP